jgi:hypothetical protein
LVFVFFYKKNLINLKNDEQIYFPSNSKCLLVKDTIKHTEFYLKMSLFQYNGLHAMQDVTLKKVLFNDKDEHISEKTFIKSDKNHSKYQNTEIVFDIHGVKVKVLIFGRFIKPYLWVLPGDKLIKGSCFAWMPLGGFLKIIVPNNEQVNKEVNKIKILNTVIMHKS